MEQPLIVWAKVTLRLGLILTAIGAIPALIVQFVLPGIDATIPALLLFLVAPLGILALALALILFLVAWVRRPAGPS